MPAISFLGWVHTILGISALLIGFYSLAKYKFIKSRNLSGEIYLFATLIVAISSLFIYHQGGFDPTLWFLLRLYGLVRWRKHFLQKQDEKLL